MGDEPAPSKPVSPPGKKSNEELYPDIKVEATKQGIEKGKDKANSLFAQGNLEESVRWFSKCIWLSESKKPSDLSTDLQSILHSNRAFAYVKLKKWAEAAEDCSTALTINAKNTKAKYRRAMALYELGKDEAALQDVEQVLKELPDPSSNKEAMALKDQIKARLQKTSKPSEPPAGFKRMQIVEEDESDEEPAPSKPVPSNK